MKTDVANFRYLPPQSEWPTDHVYIGRAVPEEDVNASRWGNPFIVGVNATSEDAIPRFEVHLRDMLRTDAAALAELQTLRGKTLVCWCKPKNCHGDVLARVADMDEKTFKNWLESD